MERLERASTVDNWLERGDGTVMAGPKVRKCKDRCLRLSALTFAPRRHIPPHRPHRGKLHVLTFAVYSLPFPESLKRFPAVSDLAARSTCYPTDTLLYRPGPSISGIFCPFKRVNTSLVTLYGEESLARRNLSPPNEGRQDFSISAVSLHAPRSHFSSLIYCSIPHILRSSRS